MSRGAILKHFAKLGIERDLTKRVQAKAESMVSTAMVTGKVTTDTVTSVSEAEICEGMVAELKTVSSMDLIDRLERAIAVTPETPDEIAENQVYIAKLVEELSSLPQRIGGLQRLVDSYSKLVAMERQAFNITDNEAPNDPSKMDDAQRNSAIASLVKTALTRAAKKAVAIGV